MAHDRDVAGIRCMEVLRHLSEYLDGDCDTEVAGRIEAHVRGCDWCERFGGKFAGTVRSLRQSLLDDPDLDRLVQDAMRKLDE